MSLNETHAFLREFPGWSVSLNWSSGTGVEDIPMLTAAALDAVDAIRPLFEPLSADLDVTAESESDELVVEHPHWFIHADGASPELQLTPFWRSPEVCRVPGLTRDRLALWISNALLDACRGKAGCRSSWNTIWIRAGRARLADADAQRIGTESLVLDTQPGHLLVPIERDHRGGWVSGPYWHLAGEPPLSVRINRFFDSLSLTLSVHWSLWSESGTPGRREVGLRIESLTALGWELNEE